MVHNIFRYIVCQNNISDVEDKNMVQLCSKTIKRGEGEFLGLQSVAVSDISYFNTKHKYMNTEVNNFVQLCR